ncbi:hypothetical protein BHE74_00041690 [Ensete ventricosum]|uniref:Uncharacterized protein n=1 Tax=Ensete ventricosum TaxID=4639 RepID=A0A426YV36_ENSVE|nr:hypothetical protein B296_00039697 [Ensete ventricosum]RWW34452.1 hypothetical protein GW17_00000769 [Ensete ventricosum]RWW51919.1 hypothetical protein BHE74_00041690 [Ensete ventricosum]RZS16063.1 hypothetical protein BHM03_00048015 [Ensete ventricosum]
MSSCGAQITSELGTSNACTSEKKTKAINLRKPDRLSYIYREKEQRVEKRIPTGIREDLVGRDGAVKDIIERSEAKATHKNLATPIE